MSMCSVAKSCPTLWDPTDCSPPGSSVHGISQATILEWVVISFSRRSSWPRDLTHVSSPCIGGRILYHWATREAQARVISSLQTVYQTSVSACLLLLSHVWLFTTPWTAAHQAACPSPGACSNSCPLSQWCHPTILSSVVPFSSCFKSFPASGSFPMSELLASGGQSIRTSASVSILPMNIQGRFPLGLTGLISLMSKGFSRVFSSTTIWRHQFFGAQLSLWSNPHINTWLLETL